MKSLNRISVHNLYAAINKVRAMSLAEKGALTDQIRQQQPTLLASCLVQQRFGANEHAVELLLNILLVSFQAMKESGHHWPLISEEEQKRQLILLRGEVFFSEDLTNPAQAHTARAQYVKNHPEAPLLAYVIRELTLWLMELAEKDAESESDKFVMMAGMNIVNCIAYAEVQNVN